jgi:hypothetical protein
LTIAAPGAGKTSLSIAEAVFMAEGRGLLDDVKAPLKVWLFNGEEPILELSRRIMGVVASHGLNRDVIAQNLFCNSGIEQPLVLGRAQRGADRERIADLLAASIKAAGIKVVIVDPFVSTHVEQENDNVAIDGISKLWARIAQQADCAVHLVHHTRKSGHDALSAESARGASSLVATARFVRTLSAGNERDKLALGLGSEEPCVQVEVVKSNNSRLGDKRFLTIRPIDIGNGLGAEPGDVVGVIVPIAPGQNARPLIDPKDHVAIKAAFALPHRGSEQSADWAGHILAGALGLPSTENKRSLSLRIDHLVEAGVLHRWKVRTNNKDVPWVGLEADAEAARATAAKSAHHHRLRTPAAKPTLTPRIDGSRPLQAKMAAAP